MTFRPVYKLLISHISEMSRSFNDCINEFGDALSIDLLRAIAQKYAYTDRLLVLFDVDQYLCNPEVHATILDEHDAVIARDTCNNEKAREVWARLITLAQTRRDEKLDVVVFQYDNTTLIGHACLR